MKSFWNTGILLVGILHLCAGQSTNCSGGMLPIEALFEGGPPAICDEICFTFPNQNTCLTYRKQTFDTCLCYRNFTDFERALPLEPFPGIMSLVTGVLFFIYFSIIIFFNINLASGPIHSFVFFYQCVPLLTWEGRFAGLLVLQNLVYTYRQPVLLDGGFNARYAIFEYCKYVAVFFATLLIVFLVWCTWCPLQKCRLPWAKTRRAVRNFREKHIGRTFIHGICSIIILGFGDLVAISMLILGESIVVYNSSLCCYNYDLPGNPSFCSDSAIASIKNGYLGYLLPSVIVLFLLLPLPLSLIYYPTIPALFHKLTKRSLPRFPKLDPVFDVFQGVYKDKMRWFAGLHLLYRMILWAIYLPGNTIFNTRILILLAYFVFILTIHSLFQPFKKPKHNYLETLYLLNLIFILIFTFQASTISLSLALLPFTVLMSLCCYKYCCKRVCCRRCIQHRPPISLEEQELDDARVEGGTEDIPYHEADWSVSDMTTLH